MADNRTGLSAADIAESFRDRCGDGSVDWVYTPMQTCVLLDAADMLDENDKMVMKLNAEHLVRQNVERENAKLRELVKALLTCATDGDCDECRLNGATPWHVGKAQLCDGVWDRMCELGIEVDG